MLSSPAYMSPEQCKYVSLVPASDVYTLGIVLYEALTGLLPFEIRNLGMRCGNTSASRRRALGPWFRSCHPRWRMC